MNKLSLSTQSPVLKQPQTDISAPVAKSQTPAPVDQAPAPTKDDTFDATKSPGMQNPDVGPTGPVGEGPKTPVAVTVQGNDPAQQYQATASGFSIAGTVNGRGFAPSVLQVGVDGNNIQLNLSGGQTPTDVALMLNKELSKLGYKANIASAPGTRGAADVTVTIEKVSDVGPSEPVALPATEKAARAAAKAVAHGYGQVQHQIDQLKDLGTRARFSEQGLKDHNLNVAVMTTALGGKDGVDAKVAELQHTLTVARLLPDAYEAMTSQIEALQSLSGKLSVLSDRVDHIDDLLPRALFDQNGSAQITTEREALSVYNQGAEALGKAADDAKNTLLTSRFSSPEAYEAAALTAAVLGRLDEGLDAMSTRRDELAGQPSLQNLEANELEVLNRLIGLFDKVLATTDNN